MSRHSQLGTQQRPSHVKRASVLRVHRELFGKQKLNMCGAEHITAKEIDDMFKDISREVKSYKKINLMTTKLKEILEYNRV
jgi:hypothetical protein